MQKTELKVCFPMTIIYLFFGHVRSYITIRYLYVMHCNNYYDAKDNLAVL